MENGKYRVKDDCKTSSDVELQIEVVDGVATCTKVEYLLHWELGEQIDTESLSPGPWERISNEEIPTFKKGDRVRKKDGTNFSNKELVATVDRVEPIVWLKETATKIDPQSLELVQISSEEPIDEYPFKEGDKVKKKDGYAFSNGQYVVTVDSSTYLDGMAAVWIKETSTYIHSDHLELCISTPTPHKYADVIKAWADGYEVQHHNSINDVWYNSNFPTFDPNLNWRIKPDNPNQDRILEIESTITELQNELEELKTS